MTVPGPQIRSRSATSLSEGRTRSWPDTSTRTRIGGVGLGAGHDEGDAPVAPVAPEHLLHLLEGPLVVRAAS